MKNRICANPGCKDELWPFTRYRFCASCRYMGRRGIFMGGALVGIVGALLKLAKVI